ncbi:CCL4 protein, partial [Syrrhaptes paradoxus]|nr:CCL4 protein [Syrrhaptes paradoxus]
PAPYTPLECCYNYIKARPRMKNLKGFYMTSKECFDSAVVFETRNGTKLCAKLDTSWVEKIMKMLQKEEGLHA